MEPLTQTLVVPIEDPSQIAHARRTAAELATAVGLDEQRVSAVSVVAVELANNILQHAGGGKLYLQFIESAGALDIMAVDHGRGMASVDQCLADGYSTASTPGLGLGAVRRFAVRFAAYSIPGRSTVVAARMSERKTAPDFAVVSVPMHGETLSGDSWNVSEDGRTFMVVDGLGHGMLAADAAQAAVSVFHKHQDASPANILERMHAALRATRGAAAAVAQIRPEAGIIDFAGLGNISCMLLGNARTQSLVSHNGTLGHQMRRVQQFSYPFQKGDVLLMHSDGLTTHSKGIPASLLAQPPFVIAPLLFSEQLRGRDDATLLVNRIG